MTDTGTSGTPEQDAGELKACPFCGGAVELEQPVEAKARKDPEWWGVVCRNTENRGGTCAIQQRPSRTKEAAIARWNTRPATPIAGEREELERIAAAFPPKPRCVDTLEVSFAEYELAMREEVIPAIENDLREQARHAHYLRLGIPVPATPIADTAIDEGVVETVARAISIPQHHTTWDLLSDAEKDLYRHQASYAVKALTRPTPTTAEEVELLTFWADNGERWLDIPEPYVKPAWLHEAIRKTRAALQYKGQS